MMRATPWKASRAAPPSTSASPEASRNERVRDDDLADRGQERFLGLAFEVARHDSKAGESKAGECDRIIRHWFRRPFRPVVGKPHFDPEQSPFQTGWCRDSIRQNKNSSSAGKGALMKKTTLCALALSVAAIGFAGSAQAQQAQAKKLFFEGDIV